MNRNISHRNSLAAFATWANLFGLPLSLFVLLAPHPGIAQITNTVFSDDFSGASVDSTKWAADSPFFEGGKGDIAPQQHDGILEFTGTVTEQWWAGATLRSLKTFPVSAETNVIVTVDRVAENGDSMGATASRSALWIMDSTMSKYVLFADVRLEGGWHYNRKIGEAGDVPTGGGNNIGAFDGDPWDDASLHEMKVIANGKTVKLYLDNKFGSEVKFPFSELVFQVGSYARANNDPANTVFDNFKVQTVGAQAFSATSVTLLAGQSSTNVTVRIPAGVNATASVVVRVKTSDPAIAVPEGAIGDTLTMTFAAGGPHEQLLNVKSMGPVGSAQFTLSNDIGMASANTLSVAVIQGPGVRLTEDFAASQIDTNRWVTNTTGFENTGLGTFDATVANGALVIDGIVDIQAYWPGLSLQTTPTFTATPELPLSFEVDRVSVDPTRRNFGDASTGVRTGVFISNADRSQDAFFAQNVGEGGWVNVNPGNPTGLGTAIPAFTPVTDTNSHRMKIVADGTLAEVFLDGASGGKFDFAVNGGIHFELAAYARDFDDSLKAVFDNVKVENVFPPITAAPSAVSTILGVNASFVNVTIPRLLNTANSVAVTVTSQDPNVAIPEGAVGGKLTLQFAAGKTNLQSFKVITVGPGATVFTLASDQAVQIGNSVNVSVTPAPIVVLTDEFTGATVDMNKWALDSTPLIEGGTLTADSSVFTTNGVVEMYVWCDLANWPGFALYTKTGYTASATSPAVFEIDRTKMECRCSWAAIPPRKEPVFG